MKKNSHLVYSTEHGRIKQEKTTEAAPESDGIIRVSRQTKGRGGKAVTVISGVPAMLLKDTAKKLKNTCATGGAVKGFDIEIQGDQREKIVAYLSAQGHTVKLAGG